MSKGAAIGASGKQALRAGFDELLVRQKDAARKRRVRWQMAMCGGRNATFDAFMNATKKKAADFVVLVVDAEDPVANSAPDGRITHLNARDGWIFQQADPDRSTGLLKRPPGVLQKGAYRKIKHASEIDEACPAGIRLCAALHSGSSRVG